MSVTFGNAFIISSQDWTSFKANAAAKCLQIQYDLEGEQFTIYAVDYPIVYVTTIWSGTVPDCPGQDQTANDTKLADFVTNFKNTANHSLTPRTPDGRSRVASEKGTVARTTTITHNWCDPTTWYSSAVCVVTQSVSFVSGTYQLPHANIIDVYHGKLTGEDFLLTSNESSYRAKVYASGTLKTEQDPHYGAGGDYVIDYAAGVVTPLSGQLADPVTVSYYYATNSDFYLTPTTGRDLVIMQAEVQFSMDVGITDSVSFQPQGKVEHWAPHLLPYIPSGTYIPLGNPVRYKTMMDFLNESQCSYAAYPAFGGTGWRSMPQSNIVIDWNYVSAQSITSKTGMRIKIGLDHNTPYSGSFATATFYCISQETP